MFKKKKPNWKPPKSTEWRNKLCHIHINVLNHNKNEQPTDTCKWEITWTKC